jgi:hypothetical protein
MSAYMRDQFPYLGIPTPERKKLSRDFLKAANTKVCDWAFVFKCWEQPEREFQYLAIDCLTKQTALLHAYDIPNLRKLAVDKSWWDSIDALDVIVGDIAFGHGFSFVEKQKRMIIGGEEVVLDLLFYQRIVRRLVAVELKRGRFKAADKGQMEL